VSDYFAVLALALVPTPSLLLIELQASLKKMLALKRSHVSVLNAAILLFTAS